MASLQLRHEQGVRILTFLDMKVEDFPKELQPFLEQQRNNVVFSREIDVDIAWNPQYPSSMIVIPVSKEKATIPLSQEDSERIVTTLDIFINWSLRIVDIMARKTPYPLEVPIIDFSLERDGLFCRLNLDAQHARVRR